jgi:Icc-related predicted phosphoesterase
MTTRFRRPGARPIASILGLALGLACSQQPAPSFVGAPVYRAGGHFSVIGDLQRTMVWGQLLMREQNYAERGLLLAELARRAPAFAVMVGDLVADGSSSSHWREFDDRSEALRRLHIPVFAVPGNHEYYFGGQANLRHYFARLPHLENQHWYFRRYGSLGLVFLDSNEGPLSTSQWVEQARWYETTVRALDEEPEIRGILVFLHHAPFTNSSLVQDDMGVQRTFIPAFSKAKKTIAMVTGHAHGYERFERDGKAFIVTGGGGGPRFPLLRGAERPHPDDKYPGPPIRHFNFVEFSMRDAGLHAEVIGLPKGSATFCRMETFDLAWPSPGENLATSDAASETPRVDRVLAACGP